MRVDTWAWAVRLFKTRNLAAASCRKEQLRVNGQPCRPSRKIRIGDLVELESDFLVRRFEVKALLAKRVGAKRVEEFCTDRTPPEDYEAAAKAARERHQVTPQRESGSGRPTKRERRDLDEAMNQEDDPLSFEDFVRAFTRKR